ncbi:MAG: phage tail protein [Candidatus Eremiobacteraeota bacterium]|nr:phage tail protein [Candidatus Eremiobacteraeota bacterium]
MAEFTVNAQRVDPYKNFTFRVKWDGAYVPGLSNVSPLRRATEIVEQRSGGDANASHKSPGRTSYDAISLSRGVTFDPSFEAWANLTYQFGAGFGNEVSLKNFRKDISIELYNEAGQLVRRYLVYRCWVSDYTALPVLDANGAETAIETIVLQNEGWQRDVSVVEAPEP